MEEKDDRGSGDLLVKEAPPKVKKPNLYKVVMINDDYTPMEFVVHVLEFFFTMNRQQATKVMLEVWVFMEFFGPIIYLRYSSS